MIEGEEVLNETLYVNNLNERVPLPTLKRDLYSLFSASGPILDIVARKTLRKRGQAFIVFGDKGHARSAKQQFQGFKFHDKEMSISYAKSKSDAVAKIEGSFNENKRRRVNGEKGMRRGGGSSGGVQNNVLFVEGIPPSVGKETVEGVFSAHEGYMETRMIPSKGVAFVEFRDSAHASAALPATSGYHITDQTTLRVTFAKK